MVCYICGKPASLACPVCGRYVCDEHSHSSYGVEYFSEWLRNAARVDLPNLPHYICESCFNKVKDYSNSKEYFEDYTCHYCDFHKAYHDDAYLSSDQYHPVGNRFKTLGIVYCGDCNNQLCSDSAIRGETKEIVLGTELDVLDARYQKLISYTEYLCPKCRSVLFYDVDIYRYSGSVHWFSNRAKFEYSHSESLKCYDFDVQRLRFHLIHTNNPSESDIKRFCWVRVRKSCTEYYEEEILNNFRY